MSFVFPVLLGGLVVLGVPILLHLIMRQKPKQLPFPAFRFLLRRHKTNLRKLRLRHLLLLALRVLLLAAVCLALARPKIAGGLFGSSKEGPVAAVLVFDTSFSMGYRLKDKPPRTLLDEAKRRAGELLGELHADSRVIVLDTARANNQWLSKERAQERIGKLKLRPDNFSVTERLADAYRLLEALAVDRDESLRTLPRLLFVFSDRTQASWEPALLKNRQEDADRLPPFPAQIRTARDSIPKLVDLLKPLQQRLGIVGGPALSDKLEQLRTSETTVEGLEYPDAPAAKLIPAIRGQVREIIRQAQAQGDRGTATVREYRDKLLAGLQAFLRDLKGALEVFVDVGLGKPKDLAVEDLIPTRGDPDRPQQAFSAGQEMHLRAKVRATGEDFRGVVVECLVDGKKVQQQQKEMRAGTTAWVVFKIPLRKYKKGLHQVEVRVPSRDRLAFNDQRYVTFEIRQARKLLIVADVPKRAEDWQRALEVDGEFHCTVLTPARAARLAPVALKKYHAACLFEVAQPTAGLWQLLRDYVAGGRNLAVIPPPAEENRSAVRKAYNQPAAQKLLGGKLVRVVQPKRGLVWDWKPPTFQHPMLRPFRKWVANPNMDFIKAPRRAYLFWEVEPNKKGASVMVRYREKRQRPALVESTLREQGSGRVLLFTTALDREADWANYLDVLTSFCVILPDVTMSYLAGSADAVVHNYTSGQLVALQLPPKPGRAPFSLEGPTLEDSSSTLEPPPKGSVLRIRGAVYPGNYPLMNQDNARIGAFSVNVPPAESDLTRVPVGQIATLFGPDSVLPVGTTVNLVDALGERWDRPRPLGPVLLVVLLFLLAVENLLANKFYRRAPEESAAPQPERATS
jgi:hypothetical protein